MNPEATVRLILESWPEARDDENKLLSSVWSNELEHRHVKITQMHVYLFMGMLMENKLTPASEILSIRDKLQRACPELRGDNYIHEHIKTVDDVDYL